MSRLVVWRELLGGAYLRLARTRLTVGRLARTQLTRTRLTVGRLTRTRLDSSFGPVLFFRPLCLPLERLRLPPARAMIPVPRGFLAQGFSTPTIHIAKYCAPPP